jgi:hypothetical protein
MSNAITEQSFNDDDIKLIDEWLKSELPKKKHIQRGDVYTALKEKVSFKDDETKWTNTLSLNIKGGRLAGYDIVRGRFGGVTFSKDNKLSVNEPVTAKVNSSSATAMPLLQSQQVNARYQFKYPKHLWIGRKRFKVSSTSASVQKLLVNVLQCSNSPNKPSNITFDGKVWHCSDEKLLERFIVEFFNAISDGESDPVLDDESGVPVELRIS